MNPWPCRSTFPADYCLKFVYIALWLSRTTKDNQNSQYNMSPSSHFSTLKLDLEAAALELVGTTLFLLLGLGGIQAVSAEGADGTPAGSTIEKVLYISTCMGFSLLISAWIFFRVTGACFNPNISLALLLVGVITPVRFVLYCIAQMLGAVAASALVLALTPGNIASKYVFLTQPGRFSPIPFHANQFAAMY